MPDATAYNPGTTGGRREDLRNVLTILEPEDTPFTSRLRKGPAPKSTFVETLGDTLRAPNRNGSKPGTDAKRGSNKASKRARFGVYIARKMEEFGVDDVQQIISEKGGQAAVDNEYGYAKAKTLREMKRDIEAVNLGSQDHTGGDDETAMMTRGAGSWISSGAQSTNPVPAAFRSLSGAIVSGKSFGGTKFTEDDLNGVLKVLYGVYGGKRTYAGIGGKNAIDTIDHFSRVDPGSNTRYKIEEMADEHEITMMVSVFDSSFGRLETTPDVFANTDATTGAGDDEWLGIFNMELWHMDLFDALHSMDLPDYGGGPNGYAKVMWALLCDSPKGNGKIYNS
jgi:hypothetical protein